MNMKLVITAGVALLACTSAHAIDAKYRQLLERSGCTQLSELQGCDINKTKEENAKAGFVSDTSANSGAASSKTPYAGNWVARGTGGATVATIRIDDKERVWVNGKPVKAKRSDGALVAEASARDWPPNRTTEALDQLRGRHEALQKALNGKQGQFYELGGEISRLRWNVTHRIQDYWKLHRVATCHRL